MTAFWFRLAQILSFKEWKPFSSGSVWRLSWELEICLPIVCLSDRDYSQSSNWRVFLIRSTIICQQISKSNFNLIAGKYCKPFNLQVERPDKMSHFLIYGPNTCCIDKSCLVQTWAKRCRHPLVVSSKKQKMCWCSSTVVFQSLKVFFSPMSFLKLFDELIFLKSIEEWKWVQWRTIFFLRFVLFSHCENRKKISKVGKHN